MQIMSVEPDKSTGFVVGDLNHSADLKTIELIRIITWARVQLTARGAAEGC